VATSATMGDVSIYRRILFVRVPHDAIGVNVVFVGEIVCSHACVFIFCWYVDWLFA
jgi:hypothetical protein